MRKATIALIFCALSAIAHAQTITGTITASACLQVNVYQKGVVGIQVTNSGTPWSGTIQPQVIAEADPNGTASNVQVTPYTSSTAQSTITANGSYQAFVTGATYFQVCGNTVTNTAQIKLTPIALAARSSGGGGSGTVSACGAAGNAFYSGAGTTVSCDTSLVDNGSGTLTGGSLVATGATGLSAGANGGSAGVLSLLGSTSGTATVTAPAVAGTSTNSLVFSNTIQVPVGGASLCSLCFTGDTTTGIRQGGAGNLTFQSAGTATIRLGSNILEMNSGGTFGWTSSTTDPSQAFDTTVSRAAAGMTQFNSGAGAGETGLIRDGNTCRITADVSLTVNTANSFCSFSLPALAKAWSWMCDIQWAITAGSGTNTFAVGVNASQTPTGTTNGIAQVYTATSGTQTYGSAAISASGATNLLTGATYTPAATVQLAHTSGTVLASGTAGTFAVTATANGTTATAAVKAGSVCYLF